MHTLDVNTSNVPAFLIKLWKLVEDSSCDELIAWSDSGISFIIKDQARFASELLPQYFKHNNMASFVRQLNMYGFKKVINYERSGLKTDNNEMEFQHSFFLKDQSELLELIKRKIPNTRMVSEPIVKSNAKDILTDLTSIKDKQESMDNMLLKMKQENELLWKELTNMRQKHKHQEQVIQKVINFLLQVIRNPSVGIQRNVPRMLQDSPNNRGNSSHVTAVELLRKNPECLIVKNKNASGPVIHEVIDNESEEPLLGDTNKLFLTIKNSTANASSKSPFSNVPPSPIVNSPIEPDTANESNECCSVDSSSLNCPVDSSLPLEPLCMLESLQTRTPTVHEDDLGQETVMGVPLEYITAEDVALSLNSGQKKYVISLPKKSIMQNVISIPENSNKSNVISIPENSQLGNILSISEGSDIGNLITISDECNEDNLISVTKRSENNNVISVPIQGNIDNIFFLKKNNVGNIITISEGSDISTIIKEQGNQNKKACNSSSASNETLKSDKEDALVIPDLYDAAVSLDDLRDRKNSLDSSLNKPDYVDSIMADSLNTPQIPLTDDIDLSDLTGRGNKDETQKISPNSTSKINVTEQGHDYLPSTSTAPPSMTSSSTANIRNLMNALMCRRENRKENTLSNHLLIVEEELNKLQDNIAATNSWNVDADQLLGLFSSDGIVNNEEFVGQLRDDITIKKEPEDLENELSLLSPPMLGVELDELRSPFLDQLGSVIADSNDLDDELPDNKVGVLGGDSYCQDLFSANYLNGDLSSSNTRRRKTSNSKSPKGKRHRVK